jgi:hypothetical protein
VRYETHAYGLYNEIRAELENAAGGQRSARRRLAARAALAKLQAGENEVRAGDVVYHVQTLSESLDEVIEADAPPSG